MRSALGSATYEASEYASAGKARSRAMWRSHLAVSFSSRSDFSQGKILSSGCCAAR